MTELAKFIFEQSGSMILNKKQVAKLIGKSVAYIDKAIHQNDLEDIPAFKKTRSGTVEFFVEDVADYLNLKKSGKNKKVA